MVNSFVKRVVKLVFSIITVIWFKYLALGCSLVIVTFLIGCSQLAGVSGFNGSGYTFPGVQQVRPLGDGTFEILWPTAPVERQSYVVYLKEGSAGDPSAKNVAFDFASPWRRTSQTSTVSDNLLLSYNTCFVVRLELPGFADNNTKELCTGHSRTEFAGLNSAAIVGAQSVLDWEPMPLPKVQYRIFEASSPEGFKFNFPKESSENATKSLPAPPFGQQRCYIVRYHVPGFAADTNTQAKCVGEKGLGEFAGIAGATSSETGTADISWGIATGAALYRIYQGADFSKSLAQVPAGVASTRISGLIPESVVYFGVRAVDASGREDTNTKTLAVTVANNAAPTFAGVASVAAVGSTGVKVTWAPAAPLPKRYEIYVTLRDAGHTQAGINCALTGNANTCRDLMDWGSPFATAAGTASEITLPALAEDQTVFVAVRAVSGANIAESNSAVKSLVMPNAGSPTFAGISGVTIASGKAQLTWPLPVGQTSNYRISINSGGLITLVEVAAWQGDGLTPVLQYTTGNLLSATTYTYSVKAVDRFGNADTNSKEITVTSGDTQAPGAVQGLSAMAPLTGSAQAEKQMQLSFTTPADTDVVSYVFEAEKCQSPVGSIYAVTPSCSQWGNKSLVLGTFASGIPMASSSAQAQIVGLEGRTLYRFYVAAQDAAGNIGPAVARTMATADFTPPLFSGISSAAQHPNEPSKVRVMWDSPGGDVARYIVYRAQRQNNSCFAGLTLANGTATPLPAAGGVSSVTITNPETTQYDFVDLTTAGQVWCFTVRAVDDRNNEDSNTAARIYTVPDLTPPAFNADATTAAWNSTADGIVLNWQAPAGAAQYRIDVQCISVYTCANQSLATCEYPSQTSDGVWPSLATDPWYELAVVNAPTTTYTLSRLGGGMGACAGAEHRRYRFKVTARKSTSDWQLNAVVKPGNTGELMPDLTKPAWPAGSALQAQQTKDTAGAEEVVLSWPKATETYSQPNRSGSGIAGYDVYLVRPSAPVRVLVQSSVAGTWNAAVPNGGALQTTVTAAQMVAACQAASAPANNSCQFALGGSYTFALRARDNAGNVQELAHELAAAPLTLSDVAPPSISAVSVGPVTVGDDQNFTVGFTCSEACSWRILDATPATPLVLASSNGATTTAPVSQSIAATSLSAGSGVKTLAIEVTDVAQNKATFNNTTSPVVNQVLRNAKPQNNVTNFNILQYENAGVPTLRLRWNLPAGLSPTDTIVILQGNATVPETCHSGSPVASKSSTDTFHELPVDSNTLGQTSFAAFVQTAAGICADGNAASRAVWQLAASVGQDHTPTQANFSLQANLNEVTVRIAEARQLAKVTGWDGGNESAGGSVCPTACSFDLQNTSYFSVTSESNLLADTNRAKVFDYTNTIQTPAWAKRYFRFYFTSADNKNAVLSTAHVWGKVPPGMVLVDGGLGLWPQNAVVSGSSPSVTESYSNTATSGDWDLVAQGFAIDKFEASVATGSMGSPSTFPNSTTTAVLTSAAAQPAVNSNWFAFAQGCLNRSYYAADGSAAFAATGDLPQASSKGSQPVPNPRRKFHLASGTQWSVAAYGTPDTSAACNITGSAALNPATNNLTCVSAYGMRNAIGNVWEWTNDWGITGPRGALERWVGTTARQSTVAGRLLNSPSGNSGSWHFRTATRISAGGNVSLSSDGFWPFYEDGGSTLGGFGGGNGWAAFRGGAWSHGANAGRFALDLSHSRLDVLTDVGGRCALSLPAPRPVLSRFGSESDGNAAKLFWLVHDTEDTSTVQLGRAASEAELNAWNGTGSAAGVTVESRVPGQSFSNNCGYTPTAGNIYTGHMCDNTIAGENYYKLCVTNPALPQVTDEFTAAQRTVCSQIIAVHAAATPPQLQVMHSGMKLQNDSDGAFARFYWQESGGSNVVRKLIMGVDKAEVERWNGDEAVFNGWDEGNGWNQNTYVGSMGGLRVFTAGPAGNTQLTSECAQAHLQSDGTTYGAYTPNVGAASGHSTGATHYACVNLSRFPKWSKLWFKVAIASSTSNSSNTGSIIGGWQSSEVHAAGFVPTGMVLVAAEEWQSLQKTNADGDPAENYTTWPLCVGASGGYPTLDAPAHIMPGLTGWPFTTGQGCVYDFAIDKYEAYNAGGTWANGAFTDETSFAGNGTTAVLQSLRNRTAHNNNDWYAFKRGCDNRTAQLISSGFIDASPNPVNRARMPTGVEWVVAAAGTKDENAQGVCNVSSSSQLGGGTGSLVNCVSRFGTFDQIGNVWEWTDELRTSTVNPEATLSNMIWKRFVGTSAVTAFPSGSGNGSVPSLINTTSDGYISSWDLLSAFPSAIGASANKSNLWAASNGSQRAAIRGGRWNDGANAGRFALSLNASSPLSVGTDIGGRCALSLR